MNTVQVNTIDAVGGAARAALRLHRALADASERSTMLVRHNRSGGAGIVMARKATRQPEYAPFCAAMETFVQTNRSALTDTFFSYPFPGFDLAAHPAIRAADVVNLHWVSFLLSPAGVGALAASGKPVVWTLHDMAPFTGGCHYSAGCEGYTDRCAHCPQLEDDPCSIPGAVLADRVAHHSRGIVVVSPSRWLAGQARRSRVFGRCRIETIPNSVETSVFRPAESPGARAATRAGLGIPDSAFTVLCCGDGRDFRRKGWAQAADVLRALNSRPALQGRVRLLCFGQVRHETLEAAGVPVHYQGYVRDDALLARLYSAADAYLLLSREDNLPNTLIESMCCGTPAVALDSGGVREVFVDPAVGHALPVDDATGLVDTLEAMAMAPREAAMARSDACALAAARHFSPQVQAERYRALYRDLLPEPGTSAAPAPALRFAPRDAALPDGQATLRRTAEALAETPPQAGTDTPKTPARRRLRALLRPETDPARLRAVPDADPADPWLRVHAARQALRLGREADALDMLRQSPANPAPDRDAELELVFLLRDAGDCPGALARLDALRAAHPGDADLLRARGGLLAAAGRTNEALECFDRFAALCKGQDGILLDMSDACRYAGRLDQAEARARELAAIDPRFPRLHMKLAQVAEARGDMRAAAVHYLREYRLHDDAAHLRAALRVLAPLDRPGTRARIGRLLDRLEQGAAPC
jgi:glycosyltransferase involved in cell wall biosynthesis/Flp pilus assembly protein TadD